MEAVERTTIIRKMGPKKHDHPSIGELCKACAKAFQEGDYTALVPLGPADDLGAREAARAGHPYNAVAVEVHWACATGEED